MASIAASELVRDHRALVLEKKGQLALRDFPVEEALGPHDVRIAVHTVGICGSDVHFFTDGMLGNFVVNAPMILGHEASGRVIETGAEVTTLRPGDRVCMEPGIPSPFSQETRTGLYNLDPAVKFWATPPVHGVLRRTVVHPASLTFKLPDNLSYSAGAMVEPLAVGVHAANKARITPGDVALVTGAGTIGLVTALAALAAGCARVIISDIDPTKLSLAARLGPITPVDITRQDLTEAVLAETGGRGVDVIFECTGVARVYDGLFESLRPGGTAVLVGIPSGAVPYDVGAAMVREARVEHVFRYAHVFDRCVRMLASGAIDVAPLITRTFAFEESVAAFEIAATAPAGEIKMQIVLGED